MLKFKEFINEEQEVVLDVDTKLMTNQIDAINADLDALTENPFVNSAIFANAIRALLERYGIVLPASTVMPMLALESETVYTLGQTGHYLYIVHDTSMTDGVNGYAQVVTESELNSLSKLDSEELTGSDVQQEMPRKVPYVRKDDDSGNGNDVQYADPSYET